MKCKTCANKILYDGDNFWKCSIICPKCGDVDPCYITEINCNRPNDNQLKIKNIFTGIICLLEGGILVSILTYSIKDIHGTDNGWIVAVAIGIFFIVLLIAINGTLKISDYIFWGKLDRLIKKQEELQIKE